MGALVRDPPWKKREARFSTELEIPAKSPTSRIFFFFFLPSSFASVRAGTDKCRIFSGRLKNCATFSWLQ